MKFKLGLSILIAAGVMVLWWIQHRTQATLREEVQSLRRQVAGLQAENARLSVRAGRTRTAPAPSLPASSAALAEPAVTAPSTNLLARFPGLTNKISARQLEPYLKANGRHAASLLAAYRVTGDPALLSEAMQKYPNDPQVALDALLRKDASPEVRREWLDRFKQTDPGNALPDYLSALDYLQAGQTNLAFQDLQAASGKQRLQDYSAQRTQDTEQACLAAGFSAAEAKALGLLPEAMIASGSWDDTEGIESQPSMALFPKVKALAVSLRELAQSYEKAGDPNAAQVVAQMAAGLGQRYDAGSANGFRQLVGSAAELIALRAVDAGTPYGDGGQTVQDHVNRLKEQRAAIRGLYNQAVPLLGMMSEDDWTSYADRVRAFGEPAALQWVAGKYGLKAE